MKKIISTIAAVSMAAAMMNAPVQAAGEDVRVFVDGVEIRFDTPPQIINDYTMVPMRAVFEALCYEVQWDAASRAIAALNHEDRLIMMHIDDPAMVVCSFDTAIKQQDQPAYLAQNTVAIPAAPVIVNERTLVPVRAISEASGCEVVWDGDTKTVSVNSPNHIYNVTDEDIKSYYENNYYHAKHILVDDEKTAEELLKRAEDGEDFDALIRQYSTDPGSLVYTDGYLFTDGEMVEPFETKVKALDMNQFGIAESEYGYHVIQRLPLTESNMEELKLIIRRAIVISRMR